MRLQGVDIKITNLVEAPGIVWLFCSLLTVLESSEKQLAVYLSVCSFVFSFWIPHRRACWKSCETENCYKAPNIVSHCNNVGASSIGVNSKTNKNPFPHTHSHAHTHINLRAHMCKNTCAEVDAPDTHMSARTHITPSESDITPAVHWLHFIKSCMLKKKDN